MSLTFTFAQELQEDHLQALSNCAVLSAAGGSGTTTSSSYADTPATSSVSFTKVDANSKIRVDFHASLKTTAQPSRVEYAVRINGTDYLMAGLMLNDTHHYHQVSGVRLISSIAAGTYTVQGRWKRTSGSGTLTMDANTVISFALSEVQE